jgi:predicted nucleic acid-binding protein
LVLADTSVWIEHLRKGLPSLAEQLTEGVICVHPFVICELACEYLKNRATVLRELSALPYALPATDGETLRFVDSRKLWGCGIGWVDAHLLASTLLSDCELWTLDPKLHRAARHAGARLR